MRHVALDLAFDPEARRAQGTARLDFVAPEPMRYVVLDAVDLAISEIRDGDGRALAFTLDKNRADGALTVKLAQRLAARETATLLVRYATDGRNETDPANIWGSYGLGLRYLAPSASDARRRRQIWSSNEPGSARRWYPGNDRPDDLRSFEIRATVPKGMTAISGGRLLGKTTAANGAATFHWRIDAPHQNHRSSIVIGEYANTPVRAGQWTLNNYGYADEADGVQASTERLADIADWMQRTLGRPLPFAGYDQVFVQELPAGMVGPGLAVLTENFVDSKEVHRDFLYLWDDLEAESVAQQWFGASVAPHGWEDSWLARGLPRYLATLYNEERNGIAEVQLSPYHVFGDLQTTMAEWDAGDRTPIAPSAVSDPSQFVNGNAAYIRAGMALRTLEGEIGRGRVLAAIRTLAADKAGQTATTADFVSAVNRAAGKDMAWFFRQWFGNVGYPVLRPRWSYDAGARTLTLEIAQQGAAGGAQGFAGDGLYRGRIEVEIEGRIETVDLAPIPLNRYQFDQPHAPRFVNLDPAARWIAKVEASPATAERFAAARESRVPLARRQALIAIGDAAGATDAQRMTASVLAREILSGDAYWRLKATALGQLRTLATKATDGGKIVLDDASRAALLATIRGNDRDEAWVRFNALSLLGDTRDPAHADLYLSLLRDPSDRIINAAARALGKSGSAKAFDALVALEPHSSWKNQSRISMLDGLAELGDPRAADIALSRLADTGGARWTLVTPVWDYRLAAAQALQRLGASSRGFDVLAPMLDKALAERHVNDAFYNANLMLVLADPRARGAFDRIEATFKGEPAAGAAIVVLRQQLDAATK